MLVAHHARGFSGAVVASTMTVLATGRVAVVARVPSAARLPLTAQIVDSNLTRFQAVQKGLEVGDTDSQDTGASDHGVDNGQLPHIKSRIGRRKAPSEENDL